MMRNRRGSSMAEMIIAGCILAAGVVPLFGFWVKLTKDTGNVTGKARAFRAVQEQVDRYQALGAVKLMGLVGADGVLGEQVAAKAAPAGRFGAALMLAPAPAISGGLAAAAVVNNEKPAKVVAKLTREEPLLRLVVESQEFPELKVERLMPMPIEPAAPAWQ